MPVGSALTDIPFRIMDYIHYSSIFVVSLSIIVISILA